MNGADDHVVGELRKNAREVIRVGLGEFNGHELANVRVFFEAADGGMRPSKAGIAFNVRLLPRLIELLALAEAEARRRGLIGGGATT